ncbi:3-methylmercaptopropionyl-CoA ligase [Paraconexibacter sp. AEG42_29]|uniref:3-methylmercaptopropionyl-CoA ligase n=2 Tax=Paraconexibacter sp. AEG42_29 TaxID=2997339 RepID=A0AAU7AQU9_9ACTN
MQHDVPMSLQHAFGRLHRMHGSSGEVVSLRTADGNVDRVGYREIGDRSLRLASGLTALGIEPGDRVATLMWNNHEHMEAYLAIPCMGAVLHTLNLRLFTEQLVYIVNHAQDRVIMIEDTLIPMVADIVDQLPVVEHWIVVGDGDASALGENVIRYEALLAEQPGDYRFPVIDDDRQAAALCYTSGTTGNPKGVLYSHRSALLHSMAVLTADCFGVGKSDRILPVVPMFHANAWGLIYAAALSGASLVMPGPFLKAPSLAHLIVSERCTVAGAVPTLWMDLLRYADEHKPDLTSLRIVPCGGAAVPRSLMEAFQERHGVRIVQAWGMTETSPLGSVAIPPEQLEGEEHWRYRTSQGQVAPLVEVRIIGEDGTEQPWDGEATGEIQIRGQWIASAYYEDDASAEKFQDGWLRTGDVAAISPDGYIFITDRSKDVIKSGGEWISSVELENELMGHPNVREAAVIAKPDDRFTERPLACVVIEGETSAEELLAFLDGKVARWWIPDEVAFIDEVPKTSVGKFDKKRLRQQLADGELTDRHTVDRQAAPAASSGGPR